MVQRLDLDIEVKAVEDAPPGTFEGYGSVFDNVDLGGDVVERGAFAGAKASRVKLLWQHDPGEPIGVWDELAEDDKGLRLKGRLALDIRRGAEAYSLLQMGALNGLSIGFTPKPKGMEYDPKKDIRRIKAVDLWEVSLVTFPMNPRATTARIKEATSKRSVERILCDAGFSRSEAKSFAALTQLPAVDPAELPEGNEPKPAVPSVTPDGALAAQKLKQFVDDLRLLNAGAAPLGRA